MTSEQSLMRISPPRRDGTATLRLGGGCVQSSARIGLDPGVTKSSSRRTQDRPRSRSGVLVSGDANAVLPEPRRRSGTVLVAGILAVALPLVGFVSLLLREQLDPQLHNHQAHFVIFGLVGGVAFALAMRPARRPTGAATRASCSCRSRSWRPAVSWACMRSGRPAFSSPKAAPVSRSRSRSGCS